MAGGCWDRHGGGGAVGQRHGGGAAAPVDAHTELSVRAAGALNLGEALSDGFGGVGGRAVDAEVKVHHDKHGSVKGADGGVQDVSEVLAQHALRVAPLLHGLQGPLVGRQHSRRDGECHVSLALVLVPAARKDGQQGRVRARVPPDQRGEADKEAHDPGEDNEQLGAEGSHEVWVGDRVGDGDESVQADDHQVQDGGGARPDVHGQPDGAPHVAKQPQPEDLNDRKN